MQADDRKIAPHDTLEGQLQRGRGEGFLRALNAPRVEVHELLVRCITHDPRWDGQLESRDDYYAQLALRTQMDLGALATHLRSNDDTESGGCNTQLTIGTLGALLRRGRRDAAELLRAYVGYGYWWDDAISELLQNGTPEDRVGLEEAVLARFPDDDALLEQVSRPSSQSWKAIAQPRSRLTKAIEYRANSEANSHRGGEVAGGSSDRANYTAMSTLDLIRQANQRNWQRISNVLGRRSKPDDIELLLEGALSPERPVSATCLEALGLRREPRLLEIVDRLLTESTPHWPRRVAMKALASLPAATVLPIARRWFYEKEWPLSRAAEGIFEAHATAADVPMLRSAIPGAESAEDYYRLCGIVEALSLRTDCGPFPELESVFRTASYSYCRIRVVEVLAKLGAGFAGGYARECLWDCEDQIRTIAVATVDLASPGARDRILEISSDICPSPFDDSIAAAKVRLQ